MTAIRNVSGTAFVVAEFRNDENKETHSLYRDHFVHLFLDQETKKAADHISGSYPPIRNNVRLRTRYFDGQLDQQLQQGCRQVVILGAGLDTRPQRMAAPGVSYFEIDAPETQAFKKAKLEENSIDPNTKYIGGNYVTDGMVDLLRQSAFDVDLPTHVIWEGNTMYLNEIAVHQVLKNLARHIQRCSVSFDYMAEEVIENRTGDPEIARVVERFAAMGAPWTYGINRLVELATECDATVIENVTMAELHRTYWPNKRLASRLYGYYSVCTLRTDLQ